MLLQCKLHFDLAFQSTLPRGERRLPLFQNTYKHTHFNPRSREGSDKILRQNGVDTGQFQSTLPRGERLSVLWQDCRPYQFQSTLPRGERQFDAWSNFLTLFISIHAPARGATSMVSSLFALLEYFNPRSREGSDTVIIAGDRYRYDFNPRSREGSDE